jgi:hypothetical protein
LPQLITKFWNGLCRDWIRPQFRNAHLCFSHYAMPIVNWSTKHFTNIIVRAPNTYFYCRIFPVMPDLNYISDLNVRPYFSTLYYWFWYWTTLGKMIDGVLRYVLWNNQSQSPRWVSYSTLGIWLGSAKVTRLWQKSWLYLSASLLKYFHFSFLAMLFIQGVTEKNATIVVFDIT